MGEKKYIRVVRHKWADEIAEEKKEYTNKIRTIILCILCFVLGISITTFVSKSEFVKETDSKGKFEYIYDIMKEEWYFGKDIENLDEYLLNNAIYGLTTNEYDIHTNYLDVERTAKYLQKLDGSIIGIGVDMAKIEDTAYITRVYDNSPAQQAGLKKGDIIVKVDGIPIKEKTIDEISDLTKGKTGTIVNYEVLRNGKSFRVDMTRDSVDTSVYGYTTQNTAVLDIDSISENSDREVEYYLKTFKDNKINRLVIDLRDNSGGYVSSVIKICSLFMEKGKMVFYEVDRNGKTTEFKTKKSNVYTFDKIVVLVDSGTASAAEVMTTCLKHNVGAMVVGTQTYGKGTVQQSHQFSDGSYIKYTVAEWLTAKKEKINNVGVEVDVKSEMHPVMTHGFAESKDVCEVNVVHDLVKDVQLCLDYLGYNVDRIDGYYSVQTKNALHAFQKEYGYTQTDTINAEVVETLINKINLKWVTQEEKEDSQLVDAIKEVNKK